MFPPPGREGNQRGRLGGRGWSMQANRTSYRGRRQARAAHRHQGGGGIDNKRHNR